MPLNARRSARIRPVTTTLEPQNVVADPSPAERDIDQVLLEGAANLRRLELLAARELRSNYSRYLPPSPSTYRLTEAYERYASGGAVEVDDFRLLRRAFTETQGASNRAFNELIAASIPRSDGRGHESTAFRPRADWTPYIRNAAAFLRRDGYFRIDEALPDPLVDTLRTKVATVMTEQYGDQFDRALNADDGSVPQFKSSFDSIVRVRELYEFAADPVLLGIVAEYLGVDPILNTPVAFLNAPSSSTSHSDLSATAQLYHHDLDRLGWVKLFIYLTDVDEDTGPHAVIGGSHVSRPTDLWRDGRHADSAVEGHGLLEREARIKGKAGTVFLVDTSALHKGVHPVRASRLVLQVQYVNSLFGRPIPESNHKLRALCAGDSSEATVEAATLVREFSLRTGTRFMQNLI